MRAIPSIFSFCGAFSSGSSWEAIKPLLARTHHLFQFKRRELAQVLAACVREAFGANSPHPVERRIPARAPRPRGAPRSCNPCEHGTIPDRGSHLFGNVERSTPDTIWRFGNWFRDRCVEAGVPGRAHRLRKAGAATAAENGATTKQLMAIFGWLTLERAETYVRAAEKEKLARDAMGLLVRRA